MAAISCQSVGQLFMSPRDYGKPLSDQVATSIFWIDGDLIAYIGSFNPKEVSHAITTPGKRHKIQALPGD